MEIKILHLNQKAEYFNEVKADNKPFEYREYNDYWKKRLVNREYDEVHFKSGYPKKDDLNKILKRKYAGYEIVEISHKHFNNGKPTKVFAIPTTERLEND